DALTEILKRRPQDQTFAAFRPKLLEVIDAADEGVTEAPGSGRVRAVARGLVIDAIEALLRLNPWDGVAQVRVLQELESSDPQNVFLMSRRLVELCRENVLTPANVSRRIRERLLAIIEDPENLPVPGQRYRNHMLITNVARLLVQLEPTNPRTLAAL